MQQSLIGMASHPAVALAAKPWLMYGKGKKQYQTLKLAYDSDVPFTIIYRALLKTQGFDTIEKVQRSTIG